MRPLSAADAVAPAWEHTRSHMFKDFSLRRYMKLAGVAFLASLGGSFNFNSNMGHHSHMGLHNHVAAAIGAITFVAILAIALLIFVIGLILFYIGSRMQFVLVETVLMKTTVIAPVWRRYGRRTWRWIGLKVMLLLIGVAIALPVLLPLIFAFIHEGRHAGFAFFISLIGSFSLLFLVMLVIMAIYFLLQDFVLPVMALEDATIGVGLGRLKNLFAQEPGGVVLYLLLRFVLSFVFSIVMFMAWGIAMFFSMIPFAIAGALLYFPLHKMGFAGMAVMVVGLLVLGLIFAAWAFCTLIAVAGYKQTYFQAYALYFYGGRYPLMGDILQPPPPVAAPLHDSPPPPFTPPMLDPLG